MNENFSEQLNYFTEDVSQYGTNLTCGDDADQWLHSLPQTCRNQSMASNLLYATLLSCLLLEQTMFLAAGVAAVLNPNMNKILCQKEFNMKKITLDQTGWFKVHIIVQDEHTRERAKDMNI